MDNNMSRMTRQNQAPMPNHKQPRKPKKRHKKWRWIVSIIVLLMIVGGIVASMVLSNIKKSVDTMHRSANITKARDVNQVLKDGKPFSILILGTDTGALARDRTGLTDSMMLITVNPQAKTTTMVSIPRDIMVSIIGREDTFPQKLNAAFPIAGVGATMSTLQNYLNVPIDFYALVNMGGLEKVIDQVGGVKVTSPLTFTYQPENDKKAVYKFYKNQEKYEYAADGKNFKTYTTMDGYAALSFSRMRYDDPEGDYGRQKRQRLVLKALLKKSASAKTLLNAKFMKSISKNAETDLTYNNMTKIALSYMAATKNQKSDHLQGVGDMYNGVSYQMVKASEKQRVTNLLRKSLSLGSKTTGTQFGSSVPALSYGVAEYNLNVIGETLDAQ
ncbi:LCP family protein [Leuconostoc suionicum]|uniref:LCP family glycopolymer transferase n=1 Tax=Leuconostoc suionicum TaxID=1511761 RepID=UPI0032DE8157